jgi:3-hydroxybutyryl-CoA dehydrogenase
MHNQQIHSVTIIGAGTMGNGIAHVCAMAGFPVKLMDRSEEQLSIALQTIEKNLKRMAEKQKIIPAEVSSSLARIRAYTNLRQAISGADLIIEVVPEQIMVKKAVWNEIEQGIDNNKQKQTIFASNTSSISISELAQDLAYPENMIGMHFFNPVPVMSLVEIILGEKTSEQTFNSVELLTKKLSKTPIRVNDFPGFVSNRILMPMINEAIYALHEGVAEKEALDQVMTLGMAHPRGPLRLADFIGLDVCLNIMNVLYKGFQDDKYAPCPLLVDMVDKGQLGNKTGQGFYNYDA